MAFNFRNARFNNFVMPVFPGASTVFGMIGATDVGKLCYLSSNLGLLATGSTADFLNSSGIIGIITGIGNGGTATTSASTTPFYVAPIMYGDELEADFSTAASTTLPATTDIGKYVGFANTTNAVLNALSMGTLVTAKGSTSGVFFKITGFNVANRKLYGVVNSSQLAL